MVQARGKFLFKISGFQTHGTVHFKLSENRTSPVFRFSLYLTDFTSNGFGVVKRQNKQKDFIKIMFKKKSSIFKVLKGGRGGRVG